MVTSRIYGSATGTDVSFNLTPMIDVTFLLIIFFILASQMASESIARLELHRPLASQAINLDPEGGALPKVVVNVLSAEPDEGAGDPRLAGLARGYKVGNVIFGLDEIDRLQDALVQGLKDSGVGSSGFYVEVRADKRVDYSYVAPAILAAANAGIPNVNFSALTATGE